MSKHDNAYQNTTLWKTCQKTQKHFTKQQLTKHQNHIRKKKIFQKTQHCGKHIRKHNIAQKNNI